MEAKSNDFLTNLRKQVTPSAQAPVVPLAVRTWRLRSMGLLRRRLLR